MQDDGFTPNDDPGTTGPESPEFATDDQVAATVAADLASARAALPTRTQAGGVMDDSGRDAEQPGSAAEADDEVTSTARDREVAGTDRATGTEPVRPDEEETTQPRPEPGPGGRVDTTSSGAARDEALEDDTAADATRTAATRTETQRDDVQDDEVHTAETRTDTQRDDVGDDEVRTAETRTDTQRDDVRDDEVRTAETRTDTQRDDAVRTDQTRTETQRDATPSDTTTQPPPASAPEPTRPEAVERPEPIPAPEPVRPEAVERPDPVPAPEPVRPEAVDRPDPVPAPEPVRPEAVERPEPVPAPEPVRPEPVERADAVQLHERAEEARVEQERAAREQAEQQHAEGVAEHALAESAEVRDDTGDAQAARKLVEQRRLRESREDQLLDALIADRLAMAEPSAPADADRWEVSEPARTPQPPPPQPEPGEHTWQEPGRDDGPRPRAMELRPGWDHEAQPNGPGGRWNPELPTDTPNRTGGAPSWDTGRSRTWRSLADEEIKLDDAGLRDGVDRSLLGVNPLADMSRAELEEVRRTGKSPEGFEIEHQYVPQRVTELFTDVGLEKDVARQLGRLTDPSNLYPTRAEIHAVFDQHAHKNPGEVDKLDDRDEYPLGGVDLEAVKAAIHAAEIDLKASEEGLELAKYIEAEERRRRNDPPPVD